MFKWYVKCRSFVCFFQLVTIWLSVTNSTKQSVLKTAIVDLFIAHFEIIINVLVSSFRFIWIPMLWVYGHQKYFTFRAGTDFRRLTSKVDQHAVIYYDFDFQLVYLIKSKLDSFQLHTRFIVKLTICQEICHEFQRNIIRARIGWFVLWPLFDLRLTVWCMFACGDQSVLEKWVMKAGVDEMNNVKRPE